MEVIVTKLGDNTEIISRYFENNSIELWSNNKTINESIKRLLNGHKDVIIHDNKVELKGDKDSTMVSLAIELKLSSAELTVMQKGEPLTLIMEENRSRSG